MADRVSSASFIGRGRELAELDAALADAGEGRPALAFIAGESGVGKSRLLRELEQRATAAGARSLGGECIELGVDELPYAPLVGAIRPLAHSSDPVFERLPEAVRCELARLAPELGEPPAERHGDEREGEAQRQLYDALLALLAALAEETPVLFWLEDLHWADRSTRSFLTFLSRSLRQERLLTVVTYRSDELHRRHPVRPLLAELERSTLARRIELAPFDRDEIRAQLADILGDQPEEPVVQRLFARSEGNPLFTEELLAAGIDGRGALPPTLRDALLLRCERLTGPAQETLRLLAVAGSADDSLLAATGSTDVAEIRAGLRDAVAANVLVASEDGRFAFRHALLREVVYDDLLPGERADGHLALARALEQRENRGNSAAAAIAHHYYAAGQQPEALRSAVTAAAEADRLRAYGESSKLLDRALSLWPRVAEAESLAEVDRIELILRAARAHYLSFDDERAVALLELAGGELDADAEPLRLARVLGELANGQWSLGQADRSRATLQTALDLLPDEPTAERARLLAHRVRFRLLQGRFREVEEVAAEALADAEAVGLEAVRASVLHRLGLALFARGEYERGESVLEEAIEVARAHGTSDDLGTAYMNYSEALNNADRGDEAEALLERAAGEIPDGDRTRRWIALGQAQLAFERGDWEAAARFMPADAGRLERGMPRADVERRRAEQALAHGDLEQARASLDEVDALIVDALEPQYLAPATALRAELELRAGDLAAATAAVDAGLDRLQFCTEDLARLALVAAAGVEVQASAAQAACDTGDDDARGAALARASALLESIEAAVEDAPHPLELARLTTARAELARAEARAEEAQLWAESASQWQRLQRPYLAARSRWREAEAQLAAGDRQAATTAATAALRAARALGAGWMVAELEGLAARARLALESEDPPQAGAGGVDDDSAERPFGLTERELQVLALVATGATNREIGEELFMAEKTASVHVSRILTKLDVRSRTEAAAVAHRQGLFAAERG